MQREKKLSRKHDMIDDLFDQACSIKSFETNQRNDIHVEDIHTSMITTELGSQITDRYDHVIFKQPGNVHSQVHSINQPGQTCSDWENMRMSHRKDEIGNHHCMEKTPAITPVVSKKHLFLQNHKAREKQTFDLQNFPLPDSSNVKQNETPIDDIQPILRTCDVGLFAQLNRNHVIENSKKKKYREHAIQRWKFKKMHKSSAQRKNTISVQDVNATQVLTKQLNDCSTKTNMPLVDSAESCADNNLRDSVGQEKQPSRKKASGRIPSKGRSILPFIADEPDILPKQKNCPHCGAKKFYSETSNFCCSDGDIVLAQNKIPDIFKDLLTSASEEGDSFRTFIRTYNNMFGFTSFGVKCDKNLLTNNKGVYTFKIQGQVYHFLNDLVPADGSGKNLQLYFFDTENEVANRLDICPKLSESVIKKIMSVLEHNPYAQFFRSLREIQNLNTYNIVLHALPAIDQRVYNKPTTSQVAALWVEGEENGETSKRNIKVYTHGGHSRNIEYYYGCYDPLQYPLLFPFGDVGWHQGIPKKGIKVQRNKGKRKRGASENIRPENCTTADQLLQNEEDVMARLEEDPNFVSLREYYAYKFQIRDNDESFLLHFGRLVQQFIVDSYVKIETQRLDYFRSQQQEIRKEFLQGIVDAVATGETQASNVGQKIFLPVSFIGGPRNMRRKYMDAMALVQKYGKPDIFLTMTCNPDWPEIREHLTDKEKIQNRPDLISRVFHAKLEQLKNELFKKYIFGEVAAYTYVIEYQKRGLPHAHFLLILKSKYKMFSPEEYDQIVTAEIPDKEKYPHLHKMVLKHMMHGPCGSLNPTNICMRKNGTCKNSYPKEFCEQTTQNSNAYPSYRRRDDGMKVRVRNAVLDNRWVVPYNPYLLAKFDCHINVEICATIKSVKYIYKYICKGHDRTNFCVVSSDSELENDEIKQFVLARWVSPPEAAWRIFRFPISEIKPAVIHLQLHLENFQPLSFKKNQDLHSIVNNTHLRKTMLTEFFQMNRTDKIAQELNCTYSEFPNHFVWKADQKKWKPRQKGTSVGRVMTAHPTEGERYYLRLLLSKVRCPTSFAYLRTYDGVQVETFREAALIRGLLQDDDSQEHCLEEASLFHMPYEMRRLFATLLVYSCPNDPKHLWLKFEAFMSEDFVRQSELTVREVRKKVLSQINDFLRSMGKNIHSYNIIPTELCFNDVESETREVRAERNITISDIDLNAIAALNEKQKQAFKLISERVYSNRGGAFFIDGPGGTGKTFLYRALLADVRSKGYVALATATSGIAASILPGGRTAHSRFKIPIDISEGAFCRMSKQSSLANLIKESRLIIWDEAPMSKRAAIEALDDLLRDLMGSTQIFGGKVIVFGGDFRQTLPVVRNGTKSETINACLINSPLWPSLEKYKLTENMRARLDPSFTNFLLRVGDGTDESQHADTINIPASILLEHDNEDDALQKLIDIVYPNTEDASENPLCSPNRAILTTKNHFVDEINDILIQKFPGKMTEYISFDETLNPNEQGQYSDILNSLTPSGLPPHRLQLKPNSPIILLRNLDPTEGLCNGTRLICKTLNKNIIHAQITVGDFRGKEVFIHRIPLQPPSDEQYPVPYKRTQFPVRLCFAMTINKAQGQTLDFVGVYLKEPVFAHGQLYVALSRAKTAAAVKLLIKPSSFDTLPSDRTKNIVKMPRRISPVLHVNKEKKPWTALVQVVERSHLQTSRSTPLKRFRRFVLTDYEGTKVSAVMYDNCIRLFFNLLWPFKRYYISNASVSDMAHAFRVSTYEFSWTITNTTLVEEHVEPVPPTLPCTFELTKFSDLPRFADTENLQNIKALIIHAFPRKEQGPNLSMREFVIVNEEKKLMLLTLWNEFEDTEGGKIANMIAAVPMIIALRLKVTTFSSLSLTSRLSSAFLLNPPVAEDLQLREWYNANKDEVKLLFERKTYKDASILLPFPREEDIVSIEQAIAASETKKTSWVRGHAKLIAGQAKYWFTACMNCQKAVNAEEDWNITCPSCKEHTPVELRCRIGILLSDATATINSAIFGVDAEKIIPFTTARLKEADEHEIVLNESLAESIKKHTLICFVRFYDGGYQGQAQKRSSIVKAYTTDELLQLPPSLTYMEQLPASYGTATPSAITEKPTSKEQFFTPTTKSVLNEIATSSCMLKDDSSSSTAGVKRSLDFAENVKESEILPAIKTPPVTGREKPKQTGPTNPTEAVAPKQKLEESPAKKSKDHLN